MKKIIIAAATALTIAAAPAYAAPNLVTNGGFEQTSRTGNFEFGNTAGAAGQVTGWTSASTTAYNLLFNAATANTTSAAGTYGYTGNEYMWASTASSQGGNFLAATFFSQRQGILALVVLSAHVGAAGQQQLHDGLVALGGGRH